MLQIFKNQYLVSDFVVFWPLARQDAGLLNFETTKILQTLCLKK